MYEKLDKCPVCNESKIVNYFICKDYVVSGESFALSLCDNCKLIFTNPRPIKDLIENYYKSEDYIPHSKKLSNLNLVYRIIRQMNNRHKLKIINRFSGKGILLDVGCGTGNFLGYCQNKGWDIAGVEPVSPVNQTASEKLGIQIFSDVMQINDSNNFDVITFWHVLEHIFNIGDVIEKAKRLITKSGKILIALPNNQSYDAQHYREFWAAYDVPRHLYHFNIESFSWFIKNHGLKIQEIIPMYFDAYYISILSEKYKTGRDRWIKSFINGYKSNSYAKKNKDYSSLIYIIKK